MTESNNKTFFLRSNGSGNSDGYDEYPTSGEYSLNISTDNKFLLEETKLPIGTIQFRQRNQPSLKYIPQDDITPYEVSLLFTLFIHANTPNYSAYYDYWGYIKENGLMRHFEECE